MQTVKEIVQDVAAHLPDKATLDDAIYSLYVRQKLELAREGKVISQEEMEARYLRHKKT